MTDFIILNYACQRMRELGFGYYHWRPELVRVAPQEAHEIAADNEYWYPYLMGLYPEYQQTGGPSVQEVASILGSINRAQQAYYFENGFFTTDINLLGIGISEIPGYTLLLEEQDGGDTAAAYAIPTQPNGTAMTGVAYFDGDTTRANLGIADAPGTTALGFTIVGGVVQFAGGQPYAPQAAAPGLQVVIESELTLVSLSSTQPVLGSPEFTGRFTVRNLGSQPFVVHFLRCIPYQTTTQSTQR